MAIPDFVFVLLCSVGFVLTFWTMMIRSCVCSIAVSRGCSK